MIIDVHAHMGWDYVFDEDFTVEELHGKHKDHGITTTIVQPGSCHEIETVMEQHNAIAELAKQHPGEFYGMANPNPHLRDAVYEREVRRCVEELGFVGIKIHTTAHGVNPGGRNGKKVFELARKLNVPVMIHTGAGIPFANPSNLIPVAEQFPEVNIVIAHCGMMVLAGETITAMEWCSNLYADVTWTAGFLVRRWVQEIGANRFMFGSDHADNAGTELAKIRTSGLSPEEEEWLMYRTAQSVYKIG